MMKMIGPSAPSSSIELQILQLRVQYISALTFAYVRALIRVLYSRLVRAMLAAARGRHDYTCGDTSTTIVDGDATPRRSTRPRRTPQKFWFPILVPTIDRRLTEQHPILVPKFWFPRILVPGSRPKIKKRDLYVFSPSRREFIKINRKIAFERVN
jgi:hypothetical protein